MYGNAEVGLLFIYLAGFVLCYFMLGVFFAFFAFAVGPSGLVRREALGQ